jgi:hypothetical protein
MSRPPIIERLFGNAYLAAAFNAAISAAAVLLGNPVGSRQPLEGKEARHPRRWLCRLQLQKGRLAATL